MNDKFKNLRSTLNQTVFQENHFTEESRRKVRERIRKTEKDSYKGKKHFQFKRPLMTIMSIFVLCLAVFLIYQSGEIFEKTANITEETKQGAVNNPKYQDQGFDLEKAMLIVERPSQNPIEIAINDLPEVRRFLEEQGKDAPFQLNRVVTDYLLEYNGKEFINIGYNCGAKLCTHLIVEYQDGVSDSMMVLETGIFTHEIYTNKSYVALNYAMNEGADIVRHKVIILNLDTFDIVPVPEEAMRLHSFEYPILSLEWRNETLVGTVPDVDDTSYDSLKEWYGNEHKVTKSIEWKLSD
ncbi:hypothetical protein ACLIA0_03220 [Bacillaceae bacterium W0354]